MKNKTRQHVVFDRLSIKTIHIDLMDLMGCMNWRKTGRHLIVQYLQLKHLKKKLWTPAIQFTLLLQSHIHYTVRVTKENKNSFLNVIDIKIYIFLPLSN